MTGRLLAVLVLAVSLAGAAGAATPSRQIQLPVPPAGSAAIVGVKLTGAGVAVPLRLPEAPQTTVLAARKGNTIFAVVLNRSGGRSAIQLGSVPGVAIKSLPDVATASIPVRTAFPRALGKLLGWNPLSSPGAISAAGVAVKVYDSSHPAGRPVTSELAARSVQDAAQLLVSPTISVRDDLYEQLDETSACILGRLRCGPYVFTFNGLTETIIRSDQPKFRLTTTYTGRTCGRSLVGQPWTVTTRSGTAARPVVHRIDLAKRKIVFVTTAKVKGTGSGTAIHKLVATVGAFPTMEAQVDSTGVWSSNAGGRVVPVSVTKLSGKHC